MAASRKIVNNRIKDNLSDRIFNIVNLLFATLFFVVILYPLVYIVSASFSDPMAIIQGRVRLWPVNFTIEGYRAVFNHSQIVRGFMNSTWYMVVGTSFNIAMTILVAYPLSRSDFIDRGIFTKLFAFTMLFSGGMIPTFMLINNLGMIDTRWAMVIPGGYSVFNIIVTRTFFRSTIPDEMLESARMDGCRDFTFLLKIVLPLSGPIIAVMVLLYALGHWNAFFAALLYLRTPDLFPLQLILRDILLLNQMDEGMMDIADMERRQFFAALIRYALIVVASLPFMLLYPLVQRFFVKGMLLGAVKG